MTVEHVEVLVEEPSTEAALAILLPKIIGPTSFAIHPHQGKQDLLAKLPPKLRAYAHWITDTMRIVVVVDRDDDDCDELKQRLETMAADAGIVTRTVRPRAWTAVNRIAIEELEAWYFGDLEAVRAAYANADARVPRQASYRHPDEIAGGTWEAFERVMQRAGYSRAASARSRRRVQSRPIWIRRSMSHRASALCETRWAG